MIPTDIAVPPSWEDWRACGIDLPPGPDHGNVKVICPFCSETRRDRRDRSLWANRGTGAWKCFHCQRTGTAARRVPGRDRYGAPLRADRPRRYTRPHPIPTPSDDQEPLYGWFERRSIPRHIVREYGISLHDGTISIPYHRDGELVNHKHRNLVDDPARQGGSRRGFRMDADAELIWYGLDDCRPVHEPVYVVEGEYDKLAMATAGVRRCLSVPNGASTSNTPNLDYFGSALAIFESASEIVLAGDNDEAGLRLRDALMQRLGPHRCRVIDWPDGCKDANDALVLAGPGLIEQCVAQRRRPPIEGIIEPIDLLEELLLYHRQGQARGALCGVDSMDRVFSCLLGQETTVTGAPGSGKSTWLEWYLVQIALWNDWRCAIFSPEQWPHQRHVSSLMAKYTGIPFRPPKEGMGRSHMTEEQVREALPWVSDHFKLVGLEAPTMKQLLATLDQAVLRYGLQAIVIDRWNELAHAGGSLSQTLYTSAALRDLRLFARSRNVHIFIVAHPTKLPKQLDGPNQGQYVVADAYDISGSSAWFEKSDNIISVWRHRVNRGQAVEVHMKKIRFDEVGEHEVVQLGFDRATGRYHEIGETR